MSEEYLDKYRSAIADAEDTLMNNTNSQQTMEIANKVYRVNAAIDSNIVSIEGGYYTIESTFPQFNESKSMRDNDNGTLG